MTLAESALRYAARGWKVFPLLPRTKKPATEHGFKDADSDVERVRAYWLSHPDANIGVSTGEPSGFDILDVDTKKVDGVAALAELVAAHESLPDTLTVRTPSGGLHYYFLHAPGLGRRIGFAPGLDVLADRGYAAVPPSVVDGKAYEPILRVPMAPWPDWLLGIARPPAPKIPTNPYRSAPIPAGAMTAYGRAALRGSVDRLAAAPQGTRNRELHSSAYSLARRAAAGHLSIDDVRGALFGAAIDCGYVAEEGEEPTRKVIEASIEAGLKAGPSGPATPWACSR